MTIQKRNKGEQRCHVIGCTEKPIHNKLTFMYWSLCDFHEKNGVGAKRSITKSK